MTRWNVILSSLDDTFELPTGNNLLIQGDVGSRARLIGAAPNLRLRIEGDVADGAQIRLAGPKGKLEIEGSIGNAIILLSGCSLDMGRRRPQWPEEGTHIHTRGACGGIRIPYIHSGLIIEPAREKIRVQTPSDRRDVPALYQHEQNWVPYTLQLRHVPFYPPEPSIPNDFISESIHVTFAADNYRHSRGNYLERLPDNLRQGCPWCDELRIWLRDQQKTCGIEPSPS